MIWTYWNESYKNYDNIENKQDWRTENICKFTDWEEGAVHKLCHPIRGYGGVGQKMTQDDRGVGGGLARDDRWRWWGRG